MTAETVDIDAARLARFILPSLTDKTFAVAYRAIQRASMEAIGDSLDDAHAEAVTFAVLSALSDHYAALAAHIRPEASP